MYWIVGGYARNVFEFKSFLSYGEDYENFWDFYINLKNKNFKIKLELCKLKKTLYIEKLWKDEGNKKQRIKIRKIIKRYRKNRKLKVRR